MQQKLVDHIAWPMPNRGQLHIYFKYFQLIHPYGNRICILNSGDRENTSNLCEENNNRLENQQHIIHFELIIKINWPALAHGFGRYGVVALRCMMENREAHYIASNVHPLVMT